MSDRWAVALALGVVVGALTAWPLPLLPVVALVALALASRRPLAVCVVAVALSSCLAARAWEGTAPVEAHQHEGRVTLLTDPEEASGAVRAEVRAGRDRLEAWFRGPAAGRVRSMLAGEGLEIRGRVTPRPDGATWAATRHLVGRLSVGEVTGTDRGDPVSEVANRLRRALVEGTASLEDQQRALFLGVVLGDDRAQSALVEDDFRAAGLSHLLAVSGQNVAFVLLAVGPLLRRFGVRGRFVVTLGVLLLFALITRFEPSVLRAATMAAVAATGVAAGRPGTAGRHLALAVAGLLLIDPLLVHSLGFRLSVAASAAILLLSSRIARHLPGPQVVADTLAVTLAAQIGVAPLLLPAFGGMPVAAVPANLVAAPVVAPLTVWGMTAGLVGGAIGGTAGSLLHLPTRFFTSWLLTVASRATGLGLGEVGWRHVALGGLAVGVVVATRSIRRPALRAAGIALGAAVIVAPALVLRLPPDPLVVAAPGVEVWRAGPAVVVLDDGVRPDDALQGLRRAGVRSIALLVVRSRGSGVHATAEALRERFAPPVVWTPDGSGVEGARQPPAGSTWRVGGLSVTVEVDGDQLDVGISDAR